MSIYVLHYSNGVKGKSGVQKFTKVNIEFK